MKILITGEETFLPQSTDHPQEGRYYVLEDAESGSHAQNKAFHALVQEYWKSGLHPKYGGDPFSTFRDKIKRDLGAGFEAFVYADIENGRPRIHQVKRLDEIPEHITSDPEMAQMVQGKLKSWGNYTKKERTRTIDNLLDDMTSAGVCSKKFDEIREGMSNGN